mmetsp:Transcript_45964/g.107851  ORF Transcript_45964/g.107851 Transcript_45964/m.107851 type:complete len:150 (-) Transcript_45964:149-598(-)
MPPINKKTASQGKSAWEQPRIDAGVQKKKLAQSIRTQKEEAKAAVSKPIKFEEPRKALPTERKIDNEIVTVSSALTELETFDMCTKFGPCMSMDRLQRWNRASKLGLEPPQRIQKLLEAFPEMVDKSIWHNRVHPDSIITGSTGHAEPV